MQTDGETQLILPESLARERRRRQITVTPGTCLMCGCNDLAACMTPAGPCHWVVEPGADRFGICSGCAT